MALIVFMKKKGDNATESDPDQFKVPDEYRSYAAEPDKDYPYFNQTTYQAYKKEIIKLYFNIYFNLDLLKLPAPSQTPVQQILDSEENKLREAYGGYPRDPSGNETNDETKKDLQAARDLGKNNVTAFYNDLKSQLSRHFTGNIDQDKENIKKLRDNPNCIPAWENKTQGEKSWKKIAQRILDETVEERNIIRLCSEVQYNLQGSNVVASGVVNIISGATREGNIVTITRNGKVFKFQKQLDARLGDGSDCYRIIEGLEKVKEEFTDQEITIESPPQVQTQTDPNGGRTTAPTVEDVAATEQAKADAAVQVFGNFDKFDQQCILLKMMDKVVELNKEDGKKPTFRNIVCLDADNVNEARVLTNLINGSSQYRPFVNIPNYVIPALIPKIRLIKSYLKEDNSQVDIELPLEEYVNSDDVLSENLTRGFGYGLKTFSWENTSFNEVDRNIDAHLVLKFSNMDSFIQVREGNIVGLTGTPPPDIDKFKKFKFMDLIYQAPPDASSEGLVPNKYHIKVSVGWSFDDNVLADLVESYEIEPLKKAIKANNVIFYLFNKGHDLNFEKDGSITVDINYQSAQEARMNDEQYSNVLNVLDELKIKKLAEKRKEVATKQKEVDEEEREKEKEELSQGLKQAIEQQTTLETELDSDIYRKFILELYKKRAVKLLAIGAKDIINLKISLTPLKENSRPKIRRLTDIENKIYGEEDIEKIKTILTTRITEKTEKIIPYFHLGDLFSLVMTIINRDSSQERLKLALGPYIYQKFISEELKKEAKIKKFGTFKDRLSIINIADLPVSMDFFVNWFEEEIVKKGRKTYTIRSFLSNIINKLIIQVLRPNCFGKSFAIGNYKLDVHLLNVIRKGTIDPLTGKFYNNLDFNSRLKINNVKNVLDNSINFLYSEKVQTIPYIYIQLMYVNQDKMIVNEDINMMQGIYHLRLGAEKGLVKEINFAKDDNKFIAPAIYAQQGVVTPGVLSVPYNAEISMIGNTIFKPGAIVYIDPSFTLSVPNLKGPGRKVIKDMRLGGFYLITRTRNVLESGKFNTAVSARWIAQGEEQANG
jgi:hypothetical protein